MKVKLHSVSLLWRILFSTSIAITGLFALMGWLLQDQFVRIASATLEDEVRASFRAYESLWRARGDQLASVSLILSRLPSVRSAFNTGDGATIRDSASEVWDQLSHPETLFLVCDPKGVVIASVAGPQARENTTLQMSQIAVVRSAAREFPKQARGFVTLGDRLYQIVITPVYVATTRDSALLNVLVAGIAVDAELAHELKSATGGSDFVFLAHGWVAASTLDPAAERALAAAGSSPQQRQVQLLGSDYLQFFSPLTDVDGNSVGELRILRSFKGALNQITAVRSRLAILWLGAVLAGIGLTYLLARRLLKPVDELDRAAAEIATGNYNVRVPVQGGGEIARLAETFNSMCASLSKAREDLIRQERIATIGRLSTSIIHDLRNPLAAIYGGAEMLVDGKLSAAQVERLAANIYKASRQVQSLLQELADVTQGRAHAREVCRLREVITAAYEPLAAAAESRGVTVRIDLGEDVELPLDRSPMERVFQNLLSNAIEAMPNGGSVSVRADRHDGEIVVSVEDTGPGIPSSIADQLFEPFVTAGKKNGVGLGLALSRKTVVSHGGDLWSDRKEDGARFVLRLPV
ncbi:MAG: integral rane sensor signal transduction histidine kinase [Bryobacterales bacterium]|nr:integral rane sensor signal transduction histidine kinase [Bryobacterales bacterium]